MTGKFVTYIAIVNEHVNKHIQGVTQENLVISFTFPGSSLPICSHM